MKIYQLFYTSCKKGLSSGMGFQTYSMSMGIKNEEREEIESHCAYIPPENLMGHPTEEEIKEFFPIAFSFFKLKSGRCCICKTNYKGRDYSGRFGNYFCHALVMDEKELNFYPIEYYNSPIFRDGLTEAEENIEVLVPLPVLEELPIGEVVTLETIEDFLKGEAIKKRTKSLNELIDGIIDAKANKKRIFYCDNIINLPMWIAAATMTFPLCIAKSFTFNTYRFDTLNKLEFICGSLKSGTRVDFRENCIGFECNLFDFEEGNTCEFDLKSKFAKQTSLGYTIVKDYRKELIDFMSFFEYKEVNIDIDNCVNLLNLVNNGLGKLNEEEILQAIDFANEYGSHTALEKVISILNQDTLKKIALNLNLNLAGVIFKFLFKTAKLTEKKEYMDKAYEFFFDSLNSMVVKAEEIRVEDIIKLHNNIRDYDLDSATNFVIRSIDSKRLNNIINYLDNSNIRQAEFYLCTIVGDFMKIGSQSHKGIEWAAFGNNGCFPEFVEKALNILIFTKSKLKTTLGYVAYEKDYLVNLAVLSYKVALVKKKEEIVSSVFNELLLEMDSQKAVEIRKLIMEQDLGGDILMNSFSTEIKKAEDKKNYFKNYCIEVFNNNNKYKTKFFSRNLEEFLKVFNYRDFTLEDYAWLVRYIKDERPNKILEPSLCERIVNAFEKIIPIIIEDDELQYLIEDMNDLKEWYFLDLKLDVGEIMLYANQLYSGKIGINKFLSDTRPFKLKGIDEKRYEEILKLMLEILCPHLKDVFCHSRLKMIFFYKRYQVTFFRVYMEIISDIFNSESEYKEELKISCKKSWEIYLEAVYFFIKSQEFLLDEEWQEIKSNIIEDLGELDKAKLDSYNMYMYQLISNTTMPQQLNDISLEWQDIYGMLNDGKKKKNILNKIQGIYKR